MAPKRVLLVEDTSALAKSIADIFTMEGYSVTIARNGQEAWNEIQSVGFDLIITDIVMPVMDGVQLINKIRASEVSAKTPIIVLSAKIFEKSPVLEEIRGADICIKKPCEIDMLLEAVSKLLLKNE